MIVVLIILVITVGAPIVQFVLTRKDSLEDRRVWRQALKENAEDITRQILESNAKFADVTVLKDALEEKVDLVYRINQPRINSLIKAPTHHELDILIDAFEKRIAGLPELRQLQEQLGVRVEGSDLEPIQRDAIALTLIYLAEELSGKHIERTPAPPGQSERSQGDIRAHQTKLEAEQVAAGERQATPENPKKT
jgi:hypothetical protein